MDLEIHKNAWPDYILDMLDDKIQSFLSGNLEVATNRWPEDVVQWSPHTLLYHFQPETEEHSELKNIVLKKWNVDTKTTCSECLAPKEFLHFEFLLHFMPTGSYMPWHNDKHHKFVATTYLNKEWDWNWGGAFLWVDKNGENKFLMPEYNTATRYGKEKDTEGISHSVSKIINLPAKHYRISLQTFWS